MWKGAYLKEKHYIAVELWQYFNSDVEAPKYFQPTDHCSLGENMKRAAFWKQAAVAVLTWRRFDSGPITSQAVKACPDRYYSPCLQFSMPPYTTIPSMQPCSMLGTQCPGAVLSQQLFESESKILADSPLHSHE